MDSQKHPSKRQGVFILKICSTTDHCFQDEIRRADVFFSMTFLKTQILVASIFFRKNFSSKLLLLSSKLRLFTKQYNVCVVFLKACLYFNELISFDYLHSNELISFDYFLNILFFLSIQCLFFFLY